MTEICEGLRAWAGKLNFLGWKKSPAKSTACDGLRNRSSKFFEEVYFSLVKQYQSFLSASLVRIRLISITPKHNTNLFEKTKTAIQTMADGNEFLRGVRFLKEKNYA